MDNYLLSRYGVFMDMGELAEVLRIKRETLYQQIYLGKMDIPHVKRGKKYLFPTTGVAAYLEEMTTKAVSS